MAVKNVWVDPISDKVLWDSTLQQIYFSDSCCCSSECSFKCNTNTTPTTATLTVNTVDHDIDQNLCDETEDCDWIEGQSFTLDQQDTDPCKFCFEQDPFCDAGQVLNMCFFLFLKTVGSPPSDEVWGRLSFDDTAGNESNAEWRISTTAPIDCDTVSETLDENADSIIYGADNEQTCDWFGAKMGRSTFDYTITT